MIWVRIGACWRWTASTVLSAGIFIIDTVIQEWYADDGNATGNLEITAQKTIRTRNKAPYVEYNLTNCNIIAEEDLLEKLENSFLTKISQVTEHRELGSIIGCDSTSDSESRGGKRAFENCRTPGSHVRTYSTRTPFVRKTQSLFARSTPAMAKTNWKRCFQVGDTCYHLPGAVATAMTTKCCFRCHWERVDFLKYNPMTGQEILIGQKN